MAYPTNIDETDFPMQLKKDDSYIIYFHDELYDFINKFKMPIAEEEEVSGDLNYTEAKAEIDDHISKGWNRI